MVFIRVEPERARGARESTSDYSATLARTVNSRQFRLFVDPMLTLVDDTLRREARRYGLRFGCESCAHYDAPRERCANGFPTEAHRGVDLERASELFFCKEFELV